MTAYNVARGEKPLLVVWGRNGGAATTFVVNAKGQPTWTVPIGTYFIAAFPYDPDTAVGPSPAWARSRSHSSTRPGAT